MSSRMHTVVLWGCLALGGSCGAAQDSTPPAAKSPSADVFSGTVTACSTAAVTVSRKGLGRDTVTKTFMIDANTKVEGALKQKSRVTVRFVADDSGGSRAIHIIVR